MAANRVWIFFYGTFMDPAVLTAQGVSVDGLTPAKLSGYELSIRPRANLARNDRAVVYGSVASLTHDDISKLYKNLEERFNLKYLPEAVLTETFDGSLKPALCFIAPYLEDRPPDPEYIETMIAAVKAIGLPAWYADYMSTFKP